MVSKAKGRVHKCNSSSLNRYLLNRLWNDQSCTELSAVRRNLFGYYESKETCQLLDKQVSNMAEKSQQEWNFDFIKESPNTGRYLWQKVPSTDVPLWYATVSRPALKDIWRQNVRDREIPCKSSDCFFAESQAESLPKCKENDVEKNDKPIKKKPRLLQTTIKDFSRVKRRSSCRLRLKQLELFSPRLRSHPSTTDKEF